MFDRRISRMVLLVSALVSLLPASVRAQQAVAIAGTAADESGAVLPGVTVTATNVNTGQQFTATTDAQGQYSVQVPIGIYALQGTSPGFGVAQVKNVQASFGQAVRADLKFSGGGPLPPLDGGGGGNPAPTPPFSVTRSKFGSDASLRGWLATLKTQVLVGIVSETPETSLFVLRPRDGKKVPTYTVTVLVNKGDVSGLEAALTANKALVFVGMHLLADPVALVVLRNDKP